MVASSGTSLTKEQIRLIKRYTPNIKIIYDGDPAGVKAALRGLDLILESDMNVKLVLLPENQDPDSFLAGNGTEAFNAFLKDNEEDFIFFKTRVLLSDTGNDPIKKTIVIRDIVSSIAKIPDTFKRTLYIRQCGEMLDLSESVLLNEVNKVVRADAKAKKESNSPHSQELPVDSEDQWLNPKPVLSQSEPEILRNDAWQEKAVCSILVNYGHQVIDETKKQTVSQYILESVQDILSYFDIELYRKIIEQVGKKIDAGFTPDHAWFTGHEDEEIRNFAINAMSSPYTYASWEKKEMFLQTQKMPDENYVRDAESALLRLQLRKSKRVIKELESYLKDATPDVVESEDYGINFKVYQVLISQRNEIAEKLGTVTL